MKYWYKKATHGFSSSTQNQPDTDAEPPEEGAKLRTWKAFGGGHKWELQEPTLSGLIVQAEIEEHNGSESLKIVLRDKHRDREDCLTIPVDKTSGNVVKMTSDFKGIGLRAKNIDLELPVEFSVFVADARSFTTDAGEKVTYTPTYLVTKQIGKAVAKAFEEVKTEEGGKTFVKYPDLPEIKTKEVRGKQVRDDEDFCNALYAEVKSFCERVNTHNNVTPEQPELVAVGVDDDEEDVAF